jgi:predicted nucleotidyltransferase
MTDLFNQLFKDDLDNTYFIYQSGITAIQQAIILESTVGSDEVTFRFPAVQYADDVNTPTVIVTEYFDIASRCC